MHSNINLLHTVSINRIIALLITEHAKQQAWDIFLTIAKNNGFPIQIIHKLKNKIRLKTQKTKVIPTKTQETKKMGHLQMSQSTHTQGYQFIKKH